MKKRVVIGLAILLVGGGAALYLLPQARFWVMGRVRGETFHEGMPTSYWVDRLDAGKDEEREKAAHMLGEIGATNDQVVPALARALEDPSFIVRRNAATALNDMGPDAAPAIPALLAALDDKDARVTKEVARALGGIGSAEGDVVPALVKTVQRRGDAATRVWAIASLRQLVPASHAAIPVLIETMQEGGGGFANPGDEARRTLSAFGKAAAPALRGALTHSNARVRAAAADLLAALGGDAKQTRDTMNTLMQDKDRSVRLVAARILWNLDRETKSTLPILLEGLNDSDFNTCVSSAQTIGEMGPQAAAAIPRLEALLGDKNPFLRRVAVSALGKMGPAGQKVVPAIRAALKDEDADVRKEATAALTQLEGKAGQGSKP